MSMNSQYSYHQYFNLFNRTIDKRSSIPTELALKQTRGIHTMLFQCWATVFDAGPTLEQHCVNIPCCLLSVSTPAAEVACLISDHLDSCFESRIWLSSDISHHPEGVMSHVLWWVRMSHNVPNLTVTIT